MGSQAGARSEEEQRTGEVDQWGMRKKQKKFCEESAGGNPAIERPDRKRLSPDV